MFNIMPYIFAYVTQKLCKLFLCSVMSLWHILFPYISYALRSTIYIFSIIALYLFQRVLHNQEDSALLKAYIAEWGKFFTQCDYLPKPFMQLETSLASKTHMPMQKKTQGEESIVRKVGLHFIATNIKTSGLIAPFPNRFQVQEQHTLIPAFSLLVHPSVCLSVLSMIWRHHMLYISG